MKTIILVLCAAGFLIACAPRPPVATPAETRAAIIRKSVGKVETTPDATSTAMTFDGYKQEIARRITLVNSSKIYPERPQALLRSVVVIRFFVDGNGKLVRSEMVRSNHDKTTEATALLSLRNAAPFPKPHTHLLRHDNVEISETWLFNDDGRFQLRTVALPQMSD